MFLYTQNDLHLFCASAQSRAQSLGDSYVSEYRTEYLDLSNRNVPSWDMSVLLIYWIPTYDARENPAFIYISMMNIGQVFVNVDAVTFAPYWCTLQTIELQFLMTSPWSTHLIEVEISYFQVRAPIFWQACTELMLEHVWHWKKTTVFLGFHPVVIFLGWWYTHRNFRTLNSNYAFQESVGW